VVNQIHPCSRQCDNNTTPMICEYTWKIEWYSVLSKSCLNCPLNLTNCDRKDCVAANGVPRSIITINRQLPGPLINVCQGDTIKIHLTNGLHMTEGTSLHWYHL
jgi:L-ascorbate oxidase